MNNSAVQVNNLTKAFGSFTAVNNISFSVRSGEIFGFLGANGAGKTTTIRMLCGILVPTHGEGTVAGYSITRESEKIKQVIGYMSQRFSLYSDLTVRENLAFFGGTYGLSNHELRKRIRDATSQF
ncbi:MAG: ABC transporter ATP-binding protein, partial [Calditrichota bacterium]